MAVTKDQKAAILEELSTKFKDAKGVVFAQYRGLSVGDAQTLRRGLREANLEYKVAKKTLIKLAAEQAGYTLTDEVLQGPIGVAFGYDDEVAAAQKMAKFAKDFESIELAGGLMEGKVIDVSMVKQLASIPSREELLAKFMGSAMSPLTGFVGIGNGLVGGFVRVLDAYREQREEGGEAAPAEEAAPEAPAAEEASAEEAAPESAEAPAEEAAPETTESEAPAEEAAEESTPEAPEAETAEAPEEPPAEDAA